MNKPIHESLIEVTVKFAISDKIHKYVIRDAETAWKLLNLIEPAKFITEKEFTKFWNLDNGKEI